MNEFTICNVCYPPGDCDNSPERNQVRSNVTKFQHEKFTVWRCSNCGSLHTKEKVDLTYYYKDYPLREHSMNYWMQYAYRNRLRLLRQCGLHQEHSILDYGCGTGLFCKFMRTRGYCISGYDPYIEEYTDETALQYEYDAIVSHDVIEHVEEPDALLARLVGMLKPNGLLAIGTPNADGIDLQNPENSIMELHQPYHLHILSKKALTDIGLKHSLGIIKIYRRFYFDTLLPLVNTRFLWRYKRFIGNNLDSAVEGNPFSLLIKHPSLLFYGFFGYFFPPRGNMIIFFRKKGNKHNVE